MTSTPPFDASPEAQDAVERARKIGYETAARHGLDLSPYIEPDLQPRAVVIQMGYALRTLTTAPPPFGDGTGTPPDVQAALDAVNFARDLRLKPVLPDLLRAIDRYDAAVASL